MTDLYFKIDSYRGYTYCVRRTALGTVCCYIDVSYDKRFSCISSDSSYTTVDDIVNLPGGCTYVGYGFPPHIAGKHEPFDKDLVIGYDYGHFEDIDLFSHFGNEFGRMMPSDIRSAMRSKISEVDAESALRAVIDRLI